MIFHLILFLFISITQHGQLGQWYVLCILLSIFCTSFRNVKFTPEYFCLLFYYLYTAMLLFDQGVQSSQWETEKLDMFLHQFKINKLFTMFSEIVISGYNGSCPRNIFVFNFYFFL
jgi:hypothetical protein